jgi:hypothetical protein
VPHPRIVHRSRLTTSRPLPPQVLAAPDLIPFGQDACMLFRFTLPRDYPWDPPVVHYLPSPGGAAYDAGFRAQFTRQDGGEAPRVVMPVLLAAEEGAWSRACELALASSS